jgi:hypothetical protein
MLRRIAPLLILLLMLPAGTVNAGKVGPEFRISTNPADYHFIPSVAALAGGGVVVAWSSASIYTHTILAQRLNETGEPVGGVVTVAVVDDKNFGAGSVAYWPRVAGLKDGGFVVGWEEAHTDEDSLPAYGQRYTAAGAPAGARFELKVAHTNEPLPTVAALSDGGFVFTWEDSDVLGESDIFGQRFAADGTPGDEFRVNASTNDNSYNYKHFTPVAGLSGRRFVVVWASQQGGRDRDIYAQRYRATGARAGREFRVNSTTRSNQFEPTVAGLLDGGFVVIWTSDKQDGSRAGIYGQRYSAGGAKVGGEFRINFTTFNLQYVPSVAALRDGGFVVTWSSTIGTNRIFGQRFNAQGKPVGGEFEVGRKAADTRDPSVAALKGGGFIAVWSAGEEDGTSGIFGQRFAP